MFPIKARIVSWTPAAVLVALAACSSDPVYPETPYPDGGLAPEPVVQAEPTATETAPPPPAHQTGPCDGTLQIAMQTAIQARSKAELARGMKAESTFLCQYVGEGETAKLPINLQPGHCYTVLAHSYPNVTELDLTLKPNFGDNIPPLLLPFANMVLAQDSDSGPTAAIGRGKTCYKNPLPIPGPGLLEIRARTGAGPVGAQIYTRSW